MKDKRLFELDFREDSAVQPKYERLKDYLQNEILTGRLKPGQALPSEHHLVEKLGIARTTVRQAMASLENEGLIRRVQGRGTFVADDARKKLQRGLDIFALIVPETREGFYPSLLHGFETAAGDIHHQTIVCSTEDSVEKQADIILQLLDKKVGGVAINPTTPRPTPAYQVRLLQEHGIPVVLCHRGIEGITAPLLALPFREMGRTAGQTLVERGHRHIAFFSVAPASSSRIQIQEGLQEAVEATGAGASLELVEMEERPLERREQSCWELLQPMFARRNPPTAIFTSFDSMAEMVFFQLQRMGLRIPEDVSLLGFGGAWREGAMLRRLTSIVVDEVATGRQAVQLLHEMRRGDRPLDDSTEYVMELGLSEGETLSAPPPTP